MHPSVPDFLAVSVHLGSSVLWQFFRGHLAHRLYVARILHAVKNSRYWQDIVSCFRRYWQNQRLVFGSPDILFFVFEIISAGLLPIMTNPRYSKLQILSQSGLAQPHSSHPLLTSAHPMTNTGHQDPHVPLPITNIGHWERYIRFL
jgi:hypothetical protein